MPVVIRFINDKLQNVGFFSLCLFKREKEKGFF